MSTKVKAFDYSYASQRQWVFGRRFRIGYDDDIYLDRVILFRTPWFQVMLHRIFRPDRQRDLHDHPWNFLSLILLGHYIEETPEGMKTRRWWNWKRAKDRHSIREVSRYPVWTLVFCGKKQRTWGFWVNGEFIHWKQYDKLMGA